LTVQFETARVDRLLAPGRGAWRVVALLCLCQCLNSVDRLVLGLASLPIMQEFHLAASQYGLLAGALNWLYAASGILFGLFISTRLTAQWLLVLLVAIWSIAQIPFALASSFGVLLASRALLGIGEGPGAAAVINAAYSWFPSERRGLPTSIIIAGLSIGGLAGAPLLAAVIAAWGWRAAFLCCGAAGAIWIVLWILLGSDGPYARIVGELSAKRPVTLATPRAFWTDRTVWGCLVAGFCAYWVSGFTYAWVTPYLEQALLLSPKAAGRLTGIISASPTLFLVGVPLLAELLIRRGLSKRGAWGITNGVLLLAASCGYGAATLDMSVNAKCGALALAGGAAFATFVLIPLMIAHVAKPRYRAQALLLVISSVTIAGLLSPMVFGWLVQHAASSGLGYDRGLLMNTAVALLGGIAAIWLLHPDASLQRLSQKGTQCPGDSP
jgi:predicted MFS family arabinose efflux permease